MINQDKTYQTQTMFDDGNMNIELHEPAVRTERAHQKHCFILHGWDLSEQFILPFPLNFLVNPKKSKTAQIKSIHDALRTTLRKHQWTVWEIKYKSDWAFPYAADLVLAQLKSYQQYQYHHSVFIGYSTGGLVARSMVSKGFPCHSLITLATPHTGLLPYASGGKFIPSVASMLQDSIELNVLNNTDEHLRKRYNFFGLTFSGHIFGWDYHSDDGLVSIQSALGQFLVKRPYSHPIYLANRDGTNINDLVHNHEALDAKHITPFIVCCETILAN